MTKNVNELLRMVTGEVYRLEKTLSAKELGKKDANYYKIQKEYKLFSIIEDLISYNHNSMDEIYMEEHVYKFLESVCGKKEPSISIKEGDNVLELLDKYKEVKDVYNKIKKVCEVEGLMVKGSTIVKAE